MTARVAELVASVDVNGGLIVTGSTIHRLGCYEARLWRGWHPITEEDARASDGWWRCACVADIGPTERERRAADHPAACECYECAAVRFQLATGAIRQEFEAYRSKWGHEAATALIDSMHREWVGETCAAFDLDYAGRCRARNAEVWEAPGDLFRRSVFLCPAHAARWTDAIRTLTTTTRERESDLRARWDAEAAESAARDAERRERARLRRRARGPQSTYVVRRGEWVKIGRSNNIPARVEQLRTGGCAMPPSMVVADPLELVATFEDDRERALHARFIDYRVGATEWFREEGDLAAWLAVESRLREPAISEAVA